MRISDWSSDVCSSDLGAFDERMDSDIGKPRYVERRLNASLKRSNSWLKSRVRRCDVMAANISLPSPLGLIHIQLRRSRIYNLDQQHMTKTKHPKYTQFFPRLRQNAHPTPHT